MTKRTLVTKTRREKKREAVTMTVSKDLSVHRAFALTFHRLKWSVIGTRAVPDGN